MHRTIGSALFILGVIIVSLAFFGGASGQTITTTTTTTSTTSSSTTTSTTSSFSQVNNKVPTSITASYSLAVSVSVDGVAVGTTPVSVTLTYGTHVITCGQAAGYVTLTPTLTVSQDGTLTSVTCIYAQQSTPTTTLNVYVQFCSLYTNTCYAQSGANVQLDTGATGLTDSTGHVIFTVPQNQQRTATWLNSGYGSVRGSVFVGTSPASLTLQASTSGFSIVSWNDNPLGVGLSSAVITMLLGFSLMISGVLALTLGGRLEGES